MIVFIVTKSTDEGYTTIAGVYGSKDKAEKVCDSRNKLGITYTYDFEEYEVE